MENLTPMGIISIILLALSVGLMAAVLINGSKHRRKQDEINRRFVEEEEAANLVRKKEIDPVLYYEANLSELPQIPDGDPYQVERCAKRTMIRFKQPISNLELKKQYGLSQMDKLALYEENFNEYLKSLTKWAASIAVDSPSDALVILEKVVELGGEFRDAYKMAADIYSDKSDIERMDNLLKSAEQNHFTDPAVRSHVIEYITIGRKRIS
jgi:hypothetical protein